MGAPIERCQEDGCRGARLEGRHCLEHLTAEEFYAAVIWLRDGVPLDACATTISAERHGALLNALRDDDGRPAVPAADFEEATFSGDAGFDGATFSGVAGFGGATFGVARFGGALFSGDVDFSGTSFKRARQIGSLVVVGRLVLDDCVFVPGLVSKNDAAGNGALAVKHRGCLGSTLVSAGATWQ
jgi:hypothetical protein